MLGVQDHRSIDITTTGSRVDRTRPRELPRPLSPSSRELADQGARSERAGSDARSAPGSAARASVLLVALVALVLLGWGAGVLSRSLLQAPDLATVRAVVTQRTGLLTVIAHALSWAGSGFVIAPAAAICCLILYRSRHTAAAALIALSSAGAMLIFYVDKLLVARPRPAVAHLEVPVHSSFPSGHATLATAFYLALLLVFLAGKSPRAWRASAIGVSLLLVGIALSRVYLGVHYPSDVAAGGLLGAAWSLTTARLGVSWTRSIDTRQSASPAARLPSCQPRDAQSQECT